jgi:plasmid stabilization system protein ParE
MRIVKLPQALIDLVEAADYLAQEDIEVADRFFEAFEATLEEIRKTPKIGSIRRYRDQTDVRMWFIRGFEKSLIFYTESSDEIVILRVIHLSRDYTSFFLDL